jgi:hypothetical protein
MPLLDVSEAFDVLFWDTVTVIRRTTTVSQYGRVTTADTQFAMQAVVTAASPDDLSRVPEYELMNKTISIYSIERLQGPADDGLGNQTMPDLVQWHGSTYVVRMLDDYSGYGQGFIHAVCEGVQAVDPPPMPSTVGSA